ncbi:leucine-rich repeat protein [Blautia sp. RTP21359st1_E11_RTP21359_211015]|uniref:leucine-rich repeat domain-containing protein n=1 Tax=Blautia sp. RTP21359st1_E11_RTP21359_211015 TaxID=3141591 RepID=UPI0034A2BFF2
MGTEKLHKLCYQPGVVMYVDDYNICRDMEVSPDVSVLHIGEQKKPSKTDPPLLFSLDKRKNYVFPGIKELVIEEGSCGVFVANTMFPNVKRVTSHNQKYLSSDRMLITIRDDTKRMLLHVFDLESTAQIDLRWISQIGTKAFEGCKSARLVNCDCVECCHEDAFFGSEFTETATYDGGLKMAGGIIIDVDETAEEIVFPDDKKIFAIQAGLDFAKAKRLVLKDVGLIPMLSRHHLPETLVIDDPNFRNLDKLSPIELNVSIKRIETTDRVKHFSSYDGILYNKTQIELLLCPKGRSGETVIPEGVRTIRQQAFRRSHIVSVKMPDSLRTIEDQAFEYCKQLKHVDFGHGLKRIGSSFYSNVFAHSGLEEVVIPQQVTEIGYAAFYDCSLKKVTLSEGLVAIGEDVFAINKLEEITIPESVSSIGESALRRIPKVYTKRYIDGLASAITEPKVFAENSYCVELNIAEHEFIVPAHVISIETVETMILKALDGEEDKGNTLYACSISISERQDTAVSAYKKTQDHKLKEYLKRSGKGIAFRLLRGGKAKDLIGFIQLDVLSKKALSELLEKAADRPEITAYIVQMMQSKKKTNLEL